MSYLFMHRQMCKFHNSILLHKVDQECQSGYGYVFNATFNNISAISWWCQGSQGQMMLVLLCSCLYGLVSLCKGLLLGNYY